MIEFPCTCGYRFSVPQELAGTSLQCPECKLLVDVPRLSDVAGLDADGTIRLLDDQPELEDKERAARLMEIYHPGRTDEEGGEIDLRVTMDDILRAGAIEEGVIGMKDESAPPMPKYDPVTGELIEVLDIKKDNRPVRAIPVGPQTLQYSKEQALGRLSMLQIPRLLFGKFGSLVVLGVIIGIHLLCLGPITLFGLYGIFIGGVLFFFCVVLLGAHYANIVEEMGPMDLDELPTPLRAADVTDDIVFPFCHFTGALFLCYFPPLLLMGKSTIYAALGLAVFSTFLFPVVLLTICTSGDLVNLRPDRLFGVIGKSGGHYIVSVFLWIAASVTYQIGILTCVANAASVFWNMRSGVPWMISLPMLVVGIILMHTFGVHLGLLYRRRHESFPWVLQKHVRTRASEPLRRRRRPYVGRPMPQRIAQQAPQRVEPFNPGPDHRFA